MKTSASYSVSLVAYVVLVLAFFTLGNRLTALRAQENDEPNSPVAKIVKISDDDIRIFLGSEFFAEYRSDWKGTPIIWPICGPNKCLVTRAWPMIDEINVDGEEDAVMQTIYKNAVISERNGVKDHPHHRSFWFNHGAVDNGDFWGGTPCKIHQTKLISAEETGSVVRIVVENGWFHDKLGRDICRDVRDITFGICPSLPNARFIDFNIQIFALEDNVVFGDTKEGSFGIRVPSPTAVTSKKISPEWGGAIFDDQGNKDGDAWGKKSDWVNYIGPVEKFLEGDELEKEYRKETKAGDFPLDKMGIAVLNGPNSLNAVPWRHVRDYGLFASNPFGWRDFEPQTLGANGTQKLNKGEKMSFSFRVVVHGGNLTAEQLDQAYREYRSGN